MLSFLVFIPIGFICFYLFRYFYNKDSEFKTLFSTLILVCTFCGWLCCCGSISGDALKVDYETNRVEIYSVNSVLGIDGQFVLGTGTIDSEIYYFYYIQSDHGIVIDKVKASSVSVVERDDNDLIGSLVSYDQRLAVEDYWFAFGYDGLFKHERYTILYVPKGTLKYNFNISLEV